MSARIVHSRPAPGTGAPTLCAEPGPVPEPCGDVTCGDCIALLSDPEALAAHLEALRVVQHELAPLLLTESLVADCAREAAEVLSEGRPGLAVHEEDLGLGEIIVLTEGRADDPADGDLVDVQLRVGGLLPTLTVGGSARAAMRCATHRPGAVRVRVRVEVLERPAGAGGRAA